MWWFLELSFDGRPLLVQKAYRTKEEAEAAGARETASGVFRAVPFNTRDKREVFRIWRQSQQYSQNIS